MVMKNRSLWQRGFKLAGAAMTAALTLWACDSPTVPSDTPAIQTIIFGARLQPKAFAWRTIAIAASGSATVHLSSIAPQTDGVVSLGFGPFENNDCNPAQAIETASGTAAQITTTVSPGVYCVRVAELGTFTGDWTFSITVIVPD